MQYPTKALAPLMLEDFRKVLVDRRGEEEKFTSLHISQCMQKGNSNISLSTMLLPILSDYEIYCYKKKQKTEMVFMINSYFFSL